MSETLIGGPHAAINSPHHEAFVRPYDLNGLKTYGGAAPTPNTFRVLSSGQ